MSKRVFRIPIGLSGLSLQKLMWFPEMTVYVINLALDPQRDHDTDMLGLKENWNLRLKNL